MRKIIAVVCLILSVISYAQTTYPLSGKLRNANTKEPVIGATIFVIKPDSTLAAGTVSDEKGRFSVDLKRGEYTIKINYLGLEPYEETLRFWRDDYLGTIDMAEGTSEIDGVEVNRKAPQATVEGDTTSYSSKAYKTHKNASAKDLVEKMPGIQDVNGELKAQGEKVQQVLVDGKQFFGQDPKTALSTLPAEVVDKIQVFDDQSEQSKASGIDDGTRIKTVNVVTKINMRNGEFGKVYAGGGTDQRYSAGGNINMFRGERRLSLLGQTNNINQQNFSTEDLLGVVGDNSSGHGHGRKRRSPGGGRPSFLTGFSAGSSSRDFRVSPSGGLTKTIAGGANYQDNWGKKVEVSSSYFYNNANNNTEQNTYELYYIPNTEGQEYIEKDSSVSTNANHKLNAKLVYKINDKASLFYIPRVTLQQNNGSSYLTGHTRQEGSLINALSQTLSSDLSAYDLSNNLMFRLNGEKRGRSLFVQGKWDLSGNDGTAFLNSFNSDVSGIDTINQNSILEETTDGLTGSIMYSEPIGSKGMGSFVSYDITNTQNRVLTNTYQNPFGLINTNFDTTLSSNYNNDWLTQMVGLGIRKFDRKGGMVVRFKYKVSALDNSQTLPTTEVVDTAFHAFLPFAIYRKRFENKSGLFMMYRTYTNAPSAYQLTRSIDNSNPLQITTGNPNLNQQYGHWFMTKYNGAKASKGTVFYAMVNGSISKNYIGQSTFTAVRDTTMQGVRLSRGSQLSNPVNLNGQYSSNAFITYGFPVAKIKSNLNMNLSAGINNTPSIINGENSNTFNQNYSFGLVISSNVSEFIDFTISSESGLSLSKNSLNTDLNTQYLVQNSKIKYDWIFKNGLTFRTQLQHQQYFGLNDEDNTILLWTAGLGKQLFKNERGEIQLSMYDILGQNNNIAQNFYDSYYQETNTNVLTRYVMLSFSYNIRKFRESEPKPKDES
jgi:hypothetical protein